MMDEDRQIHVLWIVVFDHQPVCSDFAFCSVVEALQVHQAADPARTAGSQHPSAFARQRCPHGIGVEDAYFRVLIFLPKSDQCFRSKV